LVDRARLRAGETVLITAAAGGRGQPRRADRGGRGRAPWVWPVRATTTTCGARAPAAAAWA